MPYAAAVQVRIEPDSDAVHRHQVLSESVIPQIKALPGFQRGFWMNDGNGTGLCLVVFDTEENANSALATMTDPRGPAVSSQAVYEVEIEA